MPSQSRARPLGAVLLAFSSLALGACWPQHRQNADRTGHNPHEPHLTADTVGDLAEAWRAADAVPSAFVNGGVLAFGGSDLHRLDVATGAVEWTWTSPPDGLGPTDQDRPVVANGAVLATYWEYEAGGYLHSRGRALDPATGAPVDGWDRGVEALRWPHVLVETRCVGSISCPFDSFAVWDASQPAVVVSSLQLHDPLTLGDGVLFGGGSSLGLPTTAVMAALPVDASAPKCAPPGFPDQEVFLCPLWETPTDGTASPVVIDPSGDAVYAGTDGGAVMAFDAETGGVLWSTPVDGAVVHEPALADGVLYVGTANGTLEALDAATGGPLWTASPGAGEVAGPPSVGGTGDTAVVYAATAGGDVAAFAAAGCGASDCDPLWQAHAGGSAVTGPLVAHGTVVLGMAAEGGAGEVVAYRLP